MKRGGRSRREPRQALRTVFVFASGPILATPQNIFSLTAHAASPPMTRPLSGLAWFPAALETVGTFVGTLGKCDFECLPGGVFTG